MRKIVMILILSQFSLFSQINEDEFYNTTDFYLQVHKIDKGEFLFFGNKGGIIRTYDSGDNYVQNYSGTTNSILNLENHKDYVVGITNNYEFMASQDKGSHWIVRKLTDSIVSMDASDNYVVMATLFEDILISSNVGKSWDRIKVEGKYIRFIFIINDRIYTIDKNNSIDYTDDFGKTWINIETPTELIDGQFVAKRVGNIISLRNKGAFFRLENDETISKFEFQTGSINTHTTIGENFDFATANSNTREINYYKYNTETKSEELIYSYYNVYFYGNTFRIYDLEVDGNVAFMTLENRTIMRSIDFGKTWEVVTHTPILENGWPLKVFDESNWSLISNNIIYKSTNGGVTFKPGDDFIIDTSGGMIKNAIINDYYYYNRDSAIYFINYFSNNTTIDEIYTTNDGGISLRGLNKNTNDELSFVADMNDYILVNGKKFFGRGITVEFSKIWKSVNLDSINAIDSVQNGFIETVRIENKIYLFYSRVIENGNKSSSTIAVSSDSLKTINRIFSYENDSVNSISSRFLMKSRNGNIYFVIDTKSGSISIPSYYRLDTKSDKIYNLEQEIKIISGYNSQEVFVEDQNYFRHEEFIVEDFSFLFNYIEVSLEGTEFVYDTIGENKNGLIPLKIFDTDNVILTGNQYSIYKQIEPDRLTNVEQIESKTENLPIYPFAPSPNPAKEKIKVKFYTESMEKIGNLKVHLVNIATGIKVEIKDYDISFTNNWDGEIKLDISGFPNGSYLINLSIDDFNRSSKLIISK
jgi:hypothetical protein